MRRDLGRPFFFADPVGVNGTVQERAPGAADLEICLMRSLVCGVYASFLGRWHAQGKKTPVATVLFPTLSLVFRSERGGAAELLLDSQTAKQPEPRHLPDQHGVPVALIADECETVGCWSVPGSP